MKSCQPFLLPLVLLLTPSTGFSWGVTGHHVVGEIAERHLDPVALRQAHTLLQGALLADVSTWADDIRNDPQWKFTMPFHFVDLDEGETYFSQAPAPRGDALRALVRYEDQLRSGNASGADRAIALKMLVHFVGDIHQPLHVGHRNDRGGNSIRVSFFGRGANLHSVWDTQILARYANEHGQASTEELASDLDGPPGHPLASIVKAGSTYLDWLEESLSARAQAYDIGDGQLEQKYYDASAPIVRRRMEEAGLRLAETLNQVFSQHPLSQAARTLRRRVAALASTEN